MTHHLLLLLFSLTLAACGNDGGRRAGDAAISDTGTSDAALPDASLDTAPAEAGSPDTGAPDTAMADTGPAPVAAIDLTFSGCSPNFSGDVVVVRNAESIAVSTTEAGAFASIQLALQSERGVLPISTQHRVDTGAVINLVLGATFTNIAQNSAEVLSGGATDPIGGTLTVTEYDEAAGRVDVEFGSVTLQNVADSSICTVDGRLQLFRLSF